MVLKRSNRSYATYVLKILGVTTLVLLCAHVFLQYLNWEVFYQQNGFVYELSNRFDLDDESSVSTWFSQALFLSIGLGAMLAAHLSVRTAIRRLWQLVGVLGLLLSVDEVASLHEFVLQSLHNQFFRDASPTSTNNAWLLVTPFILLAVAWFVWMAIRILPKRTTLLFATAICSFLVGAIFFDALASIVDRETFLNQGLLIAVEETLELFGSVISVYAIADYIETQHRMRLQSALKRLK